MTRLVEDRTCRAGRMLQALAVATLLSGAAASASLAQGALQQIDSSALQATLDSMADDFLLPGAVVLLRVPEGEYILTHGVRGLDDPTPVTADDHIRIGSNTKTMTGTVILQMVQEGAIALTDPVSTFRPEVPNGDAISIEMLLNMRSGLFNYSTTYAMNRTLDLEPLKAWQPEEMLAIGLRYPPYFAPDQGYTYSNTNTVLLGLIAEQIDGKPLETIFRDRIFTPLGLTRTWLPARDENLLPEPRSKGYMFTDNVITLATNAIPPDLQFDAKAGTFLPNEQTDVNPSWGWAAGAGVSTATELADYVEALTDGRLLGPELQKLRMDSPRATNPDAPSSALYGLGIAKFGPLNGHTGELPGYNSFMGRDPEAGVTLIVWANLAPAPDGQGPATAIARALLGQIYAAPPQ
jgi:D-alanyl-D-alanine carboxypeptidase